MNKSLKSNMENHHNLNNDSSISQNETKNDTQYSIDSYKNNPIQKPSYESSSTNLKSLFNNPVKALLEKNDFNNQYPTSFASKPPPPSTALSTSYLKPPKVNFEFSHKFKETTQTNSKDKDKENHLASSSEASTQTSFVESSSAASSVAGSLSSGEIKRQQTSESDKQRLKKEKIQQIIQLQKQQHEKRVKALEKLAQLERMHAEKLRKIMLNSQNDSISSLIYDSFFQNQEQSLLNGNNDTTTFDLDQLEREIKEQEYKLLNSCAVGNDKNRLMFKNVATASSSTGGGAAAAATALNKRQSCMNFNEFKTTSHLQKYANEEVTRRNSEFYIKSNGDLNNRRFSNLKNFTQDIPPFVPSQTNETPSSSVEILNLKNTTVLENRKPEGKLFFYMLTI